MEWDFLDIQYKYVYKVNHEIINFIYVHFVSIAKISCLWQIKWYKGEVCAHTKFKSNIKTLQERSAQKLKSVL